jgi:hypothetical protein
MVAMSAVPNASRSGVRAASFPCERSGLWTNLPATARAAHRARLSSKANETTSSTRGACTVVSPRARAVASGRRVTPSMRTTFGYRPDRQLHRNGQVRVCFRLCSAKFGKALGGSRLPNSSQPIVGAARPGRDVPPFSNTCAPSARVQLPPDPDTAAVGVRAKACRRVIWSARAATS